MNRLTSAILASALASHIPAQEGTFNNHSKVDVCGVCDVLTGPSKIKCGTHRATTDDAHVTLAEKMSIQWTSAAGKDWSVKFRKSPCEDNRKLFDASHDTCTIRMGAQPEIYTYKIRLKSCKKEGKGSIKIVMPKSK